MAASISDPDSSLHNVTAPGDPMVPLPNGRTLLSKPTTERQPEVNEYFHEDPSRKNCSPQELRQGEVRKNIVGRCASHARLINLSRIAVAVPSHSQI